MLESPGIPMALEGPLPPDLDIRPDLLPLGPGRLSSTGMPALRAVETVIAVSELLWQETQPDFRRNVTSARWSSGRLRSTAARTDAAGFGLMFESTAPAPASPRT